PGPGEVLIRVLRTGICGTVLHIDAWNEWTQHTIKPGLVVGHEFVGEVVELGEDVASVYPGEIVGAEGHIVCGRCRNCMAGRRALCANTVGIGVQRDGAFAEFIVMPAGNLWPHLTKIDLDVASIFDPFGNAVHTATQFRLVAEVGVPDHEFAIDWSQVVFKMLTVKGVYGRQIFETWYQMSVFVQSGLDISPVITHRFSYQQYKEAFAVAHSGQCGKVVLDWSN